MIFVNRRQIIPVAGINHWQIKYLTRVCFPQMVKIPKIRRLNVTLQSRTEDTFCFTLKASFSSSKTDSKLLLKKFDFLFTFYSRSYRAGGPSYSPGIVTNWLFLTFQIFLLFILFGIFEETFERKMTCRRVIPR